MHIISYVKGTRVSWWCYGCHHACNTVDL